MPKKKVLSQKKKWRLVVNYRKLNEVTMSDKYPILRIEEILDQLGQSQYFSVLDLASGYHQIPMAKDYREKTAFTTPLGHYYFKRLAFGLKNGPATFQRMMNSVLAGIQGKRAFVYLDDIVCYGKTLEEHNQNLVEIFKRLRKHNLKLQPDKCEFLKSKVSYLGHEISNKGVQPNFDKIEAIRNIATPSSTKAIKPFLRLVGYYRQFIKDFAEISKPINKLLKRMQNLSGSTIVTNLLKFLKPS